MAGLNPVASGSLATTFHNFLAATAVSCGAAVLGTPVMTLLYVSILAQSLTTSSASLGTPILHQKHNLTASSLAGGSPEFGPAAPSTVNFLYAVSITTGSPEVEKPFFDQAFSLNLVWKEDLPGHILRSALEELRHEALQRLVDVANRKFGGQVKLFTQAGTTYVAAVARPTFLAVYDVGSLNYQLFRRASDDIRAKYILVEKVTKLHDVARFIARQSE